MTSYNRIAGGSLERLAALSDGIFAVAMTLLVLDIHVPERAEIHDELACAIEKRILIAQALYAFGALLCVINPYWSIGFIVLVQLNYALALRLPFVSRSRGR